MGKLLQRYYTAVLGALGGLLGWWVVGSVPTGSWSVWVAYPLIGAGLGLFIGGCVAATDGALIKRSAGRGLRDGLLGAVAGAAAGLAGLLLAELLFLGIGGGLLGRTVGWMLLGGMIGLSDILVSRQRSRALYGGLGGLAGGALGGLLYEALTQLFLTQSDQAQIVIGGVGLMLLGACIGALIPLARQVYSRPELRVLSGEQQGLVREVNDMATLGSYDGNDLYLPDSSIAWRHATVRRGDRGFLLEVLPQAGPATVDAQPVTPGQAIPLQGGEHIRIGNTVVEFVGKRG